MSAAQINLSGLMFVSAMLAAILTIAWQSFDRPRHALVWALAFYVATAGWFANLMLRTFAIDAAAVSAIAVGLSCLFSALIAVGFAQRARPAADIMPMLTMSAAGILLVVGATLVLPYKGIRDALWLGFSGLMLLISASKVAPTIRRAPVAERATVAMLILFALIRFGTAALALRQSALGPEGDALKLFGLALNLLNPPAFIGIGLFTVFLVAGDLAHRMRALAVSDLLTGIFNRRGFEEAAERAIRNAQRQRQPLALVVTDIDRFKTINDRHGHSAGDRAIQHFATRMERMVRRGDLVGRIGGEEFALLLINTSSTDALDVVERIRRDVAAMPVDGPESIGMTASFGVTGLRPGDTALANLFARADRALYRSKVEGRDRVSCAEAIEDPISEAAALDLA
jgi:diguanylate cyclase (GGDEF)-like protein